MKKDRVNSAPARLALTPAWALSAAGGSGISTRGGLARWLAAASGGADPEPDDTIEVQRRRPTGESSAPRERAEAPVRRKTDGGGGRRRRSRRHRAAAVISARPRADRLQVARL